MNWGYKIVIGYGLFVAGIIFMVVKSMNTKTELITANYYQEELGYQKRIDENKRTRALSEPVRISVNAQQELVINFPKDFAGQAISGELKLYCPSDDTKDMQQSFQLPASQPGTVILKLTKRSTGLHEVQLAWEVQGTTYHHQEKLFL